MDLLDCNSICNLINTDKLKKKINFKKMKKTALIILDGWGHGKNGAKNAILNASTPFIDSLYKECLNSELITHGEHVGLPNGQMGNSEVGHLNIGAGRVVHQDLAKINHDIKNNRLNANPNLLEAIGKAKNKPIHIMGLFSDGGIHSHISHLKALCNVISQSDVSHIYIHAFTDGRDTDPYSGKKYIAEFLEFIKNKNISIVSVVGRYYSMDRDKRWERTATAYHMLVNGIGTKTTNLIQSIEKSYTDKVSDEFILPLIKVDSNNQPIATIKEHDVVICFNFRSDRCRQIVNALTQIDIPQYRINSLNIDLYTMTNYDQTLKEIKVLYEKQNLKNTLGEVISKHGLTQLRIAETEKYPHVTFFLSGGQEQKFKNEYRILIESPKVATYDLQPEMSAEEVTNAYIKEIQTIQPDFICLNYANPDMVGHTGNYQAVIKALEKVDSCLEKVVQKSVEENYALIIIADHGNAEMMKNDDGTPNTAHTTNKVPCFILNSNLTSIKNGQLCDIAPTILKIMGIPPPK